MAGFLSGSMADRPGRIAIAGGGLAAASCALELRALGFDGAVHLFAAELHAPYERPPLSKGVMLSAKTPWQAPNWFWSNQGALTIEGVGDPTGDEQAVHTLSDSSVFFEILADGVVIDAFGGGGRKALRKVRKAQRHLSEQHSRACVDQLKSGACI